MNKTRTAREMLAMIEKKYFRGAGLDKASRTEGEERRSYKLVQVERLLTKQGAGDPWAMHLSDEFWTADEGRTPMYKDDPLLSLVEQQTLTDREMNRLRLMLEIAGLCHDLSLHFTFDLTEAFGIRKNDFWASNKHLVEWLKTTDYEHIAMHTAFIMRKHAISVYAEMHYLPAQDELAELFSSEYGLLRAPNNTDMPPRDYVCFILDALLAIERHWQQGVRRKLAPDVVILHDEIYGIVPRRFDKEVLQAAEELYDFMKQEIFGRFIVEDFRSREELPESYKQSVSEMLGRFASKIREVRSKYLPQGWVKDESLEFAYLMEHAQQCVYDSWSREDDDL